MVDGKKFQILWVDDDIYDIEYFLYPLENKNCRIEKVATIPEAYNILVRNRNFDLIVLDLLMSQRDQYGDIPKWLQPEHPKGANGVKLLIQLRENLKIQVPVLLLSVVLDALDELDIDLKYSPIEFIHKSTNAILSAIDKILEILQNDEEEE